MKRSVFLILFFLKLIVGNAQDAQALVERVKVKLNTVHDYQASGLLKTGVSFMKIPDSKVTIYYKNPDKFKVAKPEGISVVPKGGISINFNALLSGNNYTAVTAGKAVYLGKPVSVIKLIPLNEGSDVMISTLYIDEKELLIRRASTTTKDNGTYEMEMIYGKYARWGLPDKVLFSFNTKDYKLPKGVTFEYDPGTKPDEKKVKNQKGTLEITYTNYSINKGLSDTLFK
ncbi:MAG TPA: hypothetical protein VM012_03190 [Flavitalea sp.]|nr:hypothetical protein [Flavitalea sp.]